MQRTTRALVLVALAGLALGCHRAARPDGDAGPFSTAPVAHRLVLLHASDGESELLAEPLDDGGHRGGIARFAGLAAALRAEADAPVLLLAAGDGFMPAPALRVELRGKSAVQLANELPGFHASAVGNHEFDLGEAYFADVVKASPFPFLTASVRFPAGPLAELATALGPDEPAPWLDRAGGRILPRGKLCAGSLRGDRCDGLVVGVVGATTETLRRISAASPGLDVAATADELRERVQAEVDALRREGISVVILLAHLQAVERELDLVDDGLVGVDVIVAGGGDDRLADPGDRLHAGDAPAAVCEDEPSCYPIVRIADDGAPVLIVAADGQHRYLGRLGLAFDAGGVLAGFDPASRAWPVDDAALASLGAAPDPAGLALERDLRAAIEPLSRPIVHADVFLEGRREQVRNRETNLGDLSADAIVWAARAEGASVDFALRNGGGIRAAIGSVDDESLAPIGGPVTLLDLKSALRFDNRLVTVTTTRRVLVETLEAALRGAGTGRGHFPQVSAGLRLEIDLERPEQVLRLDEAGVPQGIARPGERIRRLTVTRGDEETVIVDEGRVIEPEAPVRFATLDYLARGGDGWFPGSAAGLAVERLEATEVAALRRFLEHLEATGSWQGGRSYPDPVPGEPSSFRRIVPTAP